MTHIPDFSDMTLPGGVSRVDLCIGWLGDNVVEPGITSGATIEALERAKSRNQMPDDTLDSHECEICEGVHGHGQFFVEDTNCRYILPNLVIHYITAHHYKLPAVVEQALLENRTQVPLW